MEGRKKSKEGRKIKGKDQKGGREKRYRKEEWKRKRKNKE